MIDIVGNRAEPAADRLWDVAIVGAGMGGATLGHALAKAGHSVVFLERGAADFPSADGSFQLDSEDAVQRLQNGNWPTRITGSVDGKPSRFFAPLGCGAGGSSLLYAAALERFDAADFAEKLVGAGTTSGWPVTYAQLRPYYAKAEKLFKVRGTPDPLAPDESAGLLEPPAMAECDTHFFESFRECGLHPYRLHVAYRYVPGCTECGGHICPRACKGDARTVCLLPALAAGNATLIDRCEVERLDADASVVREVVCRRDGGRLSVRARIVVLAAGAYHTPVLLLKSACERWPDGLANSSGMVGRNLMFHVSDYIAVWPRGNYATDGPRKTLGFRDFCRYRGEKLGSVQSTGRTVGYGYIVYFLKSAFDRSRWSWLRPLRPLVRIPAYLATWLFGRATVFATIMEDRPFPENRVVPDAEEPGGMRFDYTVHDELRTRIRLLRAALKKTLSRHRLLFLGEEVNLNYGHPCGTCRAGNDPATSVVDANNKAHELDNLYVVDASFMPASGAANPALTIAANALRVAEHLSARLARREPAPGESGISAART